MTDNNQFFVSVIIPTLNDINRLLICLQSIDRQTYPKDNCEVIVVDNGSDKNYAAILKKFSNVKLLIEKKPGSYAARNMGIKHAKGDILAFTDSDCIPKNDWIKNGVNRLTNTPNCGLVGGKIELFFKNPLNPTIAEIYDSITFLNQENCVNKANFGATANLFTYKKVFQHVGMFNSNLKSGGDNEWGNRVAQNGYKVIYSKNSIVKHPARSSLAQMYRKVIRVNRGFHSLKNLEKSTSHQLYEILRNDVLPPIARIKKTIKKNKARNYSNQIKLVLGILIFKYSILLDKLYLALNKSNK